MAVAGSGAWRRPGNGPGIGGGEGERPVEPGGSEARMAALWKDNPPIIIPSQARAGGWTGTDYKGP